MALAAIAALVWFFHQVSSRAVTDIITVEDPLTVLFVCIQVVHSFHVPSRRDLLFSLGASAALMAVGAAQAIDLRYGVYVLLWVGFVLWSLVESWTSASQGGRTSATWTWHRSPCRRGGRGGHLPGAAGPDRGGPDQLPGDRRERRARWGSRGAGRRCRQSHGAVPARESSRSDSRRAATSASPTAWTPPFAAN